jgi:Transposase IS116/IS110/IS902 family
VSDLLSARGRALLRQRLELLPPCTAYATQQLLEHVENLDRQIRGFEHKIQTVFKPAPAIQLLLTLPGVGLTLAVIIALEVGNIERFATAEKLAAYAGTTPASTSPIMPPHDGEDMAPTKRIDDTRDDDGVSQQIHALDCVDEFCNDASRWGSTAREREGTRYVVAGTVPLEPSRRCHAADRAERRQRLRGVPRRNPTEPRLSQEQRNNRRSDAVKPQQPRDGRALGLADQLHPVMQSRRTAYRLGGAGFGSIQCRQTGFGARNLQRVARGGSTSQRYGTAGPTSKK